jgi:hypothetical protein
MTDVSEQIDIEIALYVSCCRSASLHDGYEQIHKTLARIIFYHIQEMRSTGKAVPLDLFIK